MKPRTGSYVLFLRLPTPATVTVGKLGRLGFDRPYYAYAGSALGPGGIAARVGRHLRTGKKQHWHIDYLRERAEIVSVWELRSDAGGECLLANALATLNEADPVRGFGATDCRCRSHLVGLARLPRLPAFRTQLQRSAGAMATPAGNLRRFGMGASASGPGQPPPDLRRSVGPGI